MDCRDEVAPATCAHLVGLDLYETNVLRYAHFKYLIFAAIIHFFLPDYLISTGASLL
jgi:hypothetical protein